jgi:uncharacterized protein (TIGR02246 family)
MSNFQEETAIKALIRLQIEAIKNKDITGATTNYRPDVVLFDVVGPLQHQGSASVKQRLKEWFSSFKNYEPVGFETIDLKVMASNDIAFSYGFNHVSAALKNGGKLDMYWRETLNWQKNHELWQIVSAHSSVPFDANTGMASTGLKPEPRSKR